PTSLRYAACDRPRGAAAVPVRSAAWPSPAGCGSSAASDSPARSEYSCSASALLSSPSFPLLRQPFECAIGDVLRHGTFPCNSLKTVPTAVGKDAKGCGTHCSLDLILSFGLASLSGFDRFVGD